MHQPCEYLCIGVDLGAYVTLPHYFEALDTEGKNGGSECEDHRGEVSQA